MSAEGEELVRAIAERFSGVRPLLEDHLNFYEHILPHVFFGDLTRHVISLLAATHSQDRTGRDELTGILDVLEQAFTSNRGDLQELISVSFLENLPWESGGHLGFLPMLGPNLSKELKGIIDWRPGNSDGKK